MKDGERDGTYICSTVMILLVAIDGRRAFERTTEGGPTTASLLHQEKICVSLGCCLVTDSGIPCP